MSKVLVEYTRRYLRGRLGTDAFVESFLELWKIEGELGLLQADDEDIGGGLALIFSAVEAYSPRVDRQPWAFDEARLRGELEKIIGCSV